VGRLLAIAALSCVAVAGCGGGGSSTDTIKVVHVGPEEVTIPSDTKPGVLSVTRALLAQTGYERWYQGCIMGQAQRLLTPAEAEALAKEREGERNRASVQLFARAAPACETSTRNIIRPDASGSELRPIRTQTALSFETLFSGKEYVPSFGPCIGRQVEKTTDRQLIELANVHGKEQEELFERLFAPCAP
jgi:hypothetical protein